MLTIKPVRDTFFLINRIQNRVSILLNSSCKNDNLVVFSHLIKKLLTIRTNQACILRPLNFLIMYKSLIHIQHKRIFLLTLQAWQERRLRPVDSLVNGVGQYCIQRDEHSGDFSDLVDKLNFFIGKNLEHKGFQRIKPTIGKNALNNINKRLVILGQQAHPILIMLNPPTILIKPRRIIHMELRRDGKLLHIHYLHQHVQNNQIVLVNVLCK